MTNHPKSPIEQAGEVQASSPLRATQITQAGEVQTPPETPSDAAMQATEEIAAIEQPRHTNTFIPLDDCDICANYKRRVAAIITRHLAAGKKLKLL